MAVSKQTEQQCIAILGKELVPSMGCSDPGCIAYVAAAARRALGELPQRIVLKISGSLLRNATGVYVPYSGHLRGPSVAAVMGVVCGDPEKRLEAISGATDQDRETVRALLEQKDFCSLEVFPAGPKVQATVQAYHGENMAEAVLAGSHSNLIRVMKNGEVLYENQTTPEDAASAANQDAETPSIKEIYEFAKQVDVKEIEPILLQQIACNKKIAQEGLTGEYGPNIGRCLWNSAGEDVLEKARAYAVTGADARMSGCALTVIANGTSGNQGITVCVPPVVYAEEKGIPQETLLRALALGNLICIRIKEGMRGISSFCKQINAAIGAAAAIAFLEDGSLRMIEDVIRNALSGATGMICDGAKPSCAYKIAVALENAFLGYRLAKDGKSMEGGTGIVKEDVEQMIDAVGTLVQDGMRETADVILKIMLD